MDWNLRSCARGGHVTYAPDEPAYRAKLTAETPLGDAWRCLRCGDYVLGEPHGSGPADDAPVLLRGKALALGVHPATAGDRALGPRRDHPAARARGAAVQEHQGQPEGAVRPRPASRSSRSSTRSTSTSPTPAPIKAIDNALRAHQSTLDLVAAFLIFYGLLQLVEGVGLWLLKRWGEYFAVVATSLFLPLEVYELTEKVTWLRVVAFVVNLAAVVYLLLSKRLFGLRGGHAAYRAEQHEASLLEVEASSSGATSA